MYLPNHWWHATFNKGDWVLTVGGQVASPGTVYDAAAGDVAALRSGKASTKQLFAAASNGHLSVLELSSTEGVDLSSKGPDGQAAGHSAVGSGHAAVLELLSIQGVDPSSENKDGKTAGHYAAGSGHAAGLKLLFTRAWTCRR